MSRTVVITGAGGGLGRAIARSFAAEGARIVAADVSRANLDSLLETCPGAEAVVADVSTPAGCDAIVGAAGAVDVLVNNAGIFHSGDADSVADDVFAAVLAVHLTGAYMMCHRVLPGMLERGAGIIVNMSSVAGLRGAPAGTAYTVAKWGMIGLTQNISATMGGRGVRCNAICPSMVAVEEQVSDRIMVGERPSPDSIAARAAEVARRPPGTDPGQVAAAVRFLASEDARHINGVALPIDNGWLTRIS